MTIIKPLQDLNHQLDAAFKTLVDDPSSLEKQSTYEQLKAKLDEAIVNAKAQIND
jgi:hypothetical protein